MEYPLSWLVPLATVALYVVWGLWYQATNPEASSGD
jgi:hypothetical protein